MRSPTLTLALLALLAGPATAAEDQVALNFLDAEAMSVVEFYAGIVGKPFLPQDDLKFTISVVAPGPVTHATALEMFDTALSLKGYSLTDHGGYVAIVRRAEATATSVPALRDDTPGDRFATLVVPLTRLAPERAAEAIKATLSSAGRSSAGAGALVMVDAARNLRAAAALLTQLEAGHLAPRTRVQRLMYADLAKVIPALQQVFVEELRPGSTGVASLQLVPLPEAQQLVVVAPDPIQQRVEEVLRQLDVRTRQVLIEVNLVDVSLTETTSLGLDWTRNGTLPGVGGSSVVTGQAGLKYTFLRPNSWKAVIEAIQTTTKAEILATPRLVAADGQKASLHVGEEFPVPKESRVDANSNLIKTFDYKKVGLTTTITPRIAANRDIQLTVSQIVSELISINEEELTYRIGERQADTQVLLRDGHTLVIGGLIKSSNRQTSSGIPYLARIPGIGWLFGGQSSSPSKSELLIFITPQVIETPEEADERTRREHEQARDVLEVSGAEFRL